jgi:transposase
MTKPYSSDLRSRVVAAVEAGSSRRQAAARFGVAVSTVVHWVRRWRETGSFAARPVGGDRRSKLKGADRDWLLARIAAKPDLTLEEVRAELRGLGKRVGYGTVWRFFATHGISFKKNRARRRAGPARRGGRARGMARNASSA